ncbi:MAG: hypothetical protein AAF840_14775, partial [Bacteroidota bacterium]
RDSLIVMHKLMEVSYYHCYQTINTILIDREHIENQQLNPLQATHLTLFYYRLDDNFKKFGHTGTSVPGYPGNAGTSTT